MEENKAKSSNKILIIVFLLVIVGLLVFCALGFIENNDLKDKNKRLEREISSLKDDISNKLKESTIEKNYLEYNTKFKIYALHHEYVAFSYNDELYLATFGDGNIDSTLYLAESSDFTESNVAENDTNTRVVKLNIKTDNVNKVILKHADMFRDPTGEIFILYNDNGLTHFYVSYGLDRTNNDKILTDYKEIVNVKTTCIDEEDCQKVKYTIITRDGNSTELEELK